MFNRIVLFSLALAIPHSLSNVAVGYLLIEFPLILFFCFVTLFIITWSIVIRASTVLLRPAQIPGDHWVKLSRYLAVLFIVVVFGMSLDFSHANRFY